VVPEIKPLSKADARKLASWEPEAALDEWAGKASHLGLKWETTHTWNSDRARGCIHASSFNRKCDMFLYLERIGCKPISRTPASKQKIYDTGTAIHLLMNYYQQTRAQHHGYKCNSEVWVGSYDIAKALHLCGNADDVIWGWPIKRRIVWDYKSINKRGFSGLTRPSRDYIRQLNSYMGCLGAAVGVICYYHKDTADMLCFVTYFDPQLWEKDIAERARRINIHADKLDSGPKRVVSSYCYICSYLQDCEPPLPRRRSPLPKV
jgi:hypothetical protein